MRPLGVGVSVLSAIGALIWFVVVACYILRHNTCSEHCAMTNAERFAFVTLPVIVGCLGVIGAWAARRFIP